MVSEGMNRKYAEGRIKNFEEIIGRLRDIRGRDMEIRQIAQK
ncbi:MAG: hypothetical protein RMJ17_02090 [Candidatus Aenigmarchaeota archaeon]|nr:hypothetical protein [Candidatus Aenigmarchaeota archaeon]MDW8149363.1 hypothetical protein [Candidatus Aenigmarchaeota archaeon]